MVSDLAKFMEFNSIPKAHLIGHSMGGKVSIAFANDYPDKIISLSVVDIAPKNYLIAGNSPMQYQFHKNLIETLLAIDLCCIKNRSDVELILQEKLKDVRLVKFITKNLKRNKDQTFNWKLNLKTLAEQLEHIVSGVTYADYDDRIPINLFPVLFIKGGKSSYITRDDFKDIQQMYPDAQIKTIKNGGHWLHAETGNEFIQLLSSFLHQH